MRYALPLALACALTLLLAAVSADANDTADVRRTLATIRTTATSEEPADFEAHLSATALARLTPDGRALHLRSLRAALAGSRVTGVRVDGAHAVATLARQGRGGGHFEIALLRQGDRWRLATPFVHATTGTTFERRNGRAPARIRLELRTTNGPYGASAYSFRYASKDAVACKNRMDVWACHNEDIHASGDSVIAAVGKKKLARVKGIPVGVDWARHAHIERGQVYVVHCMDRRDRDFYVKFRVVSFRDGAAEIEWTLLSDGFGAPASIHESERPVDNSGSDGCDGICARHGR